ncbi:hypothetical protein EJD97_017829 [Solanum chilense]|uniref:Uncharacterized protein n=1 Tax=Solanum chilense TaxID=4083 RepID=A0A6N2B267_SOLCI|nr:hypothetical protein EJD97_017829 [Solanum chilense]
MALKKSTNMEFYTIVTRSAKKAKAKLGPSANTRSSKIAKLTISVPLSSASKMMKNFGVLTRGMIYRAKVKTKEIDNIQPKIFEVGSRKKGTKVENSKIMTRRGKAKLDSDQKVQPKSTKGF